MIRNKTPHGAVFLVFALPWMAISQPSSTPQDTAFTYQGVLRDSGGQPLAGQYEFKFSLFTAAVGGGQAAAPFIAGPVAVDAGAFAIALDFGAPAFVGGGRWLEIGVRTNGSVADFTTLSPGNRSPPRPMPSWRVGWRAIPRRTTHRTRTS